MENNSKVNENRVASKIVKILNQTTEAIKITDDPFIEVLDDFGRNVTEKWNEFAEARNARSIAIRDQELEKLDKELLDLGHSRSEEANNKRVRIGDAKARILDSYDNKGLLLGESDTWAAFDQYSMFTNLHNWQLWISLYMTSWPFRKIIDQQSADIAGHGIKIKFPAEYIEKKVIRYDPDTGRPIKIRVRTPKVSSDQITEIYERHERLVPELTELVSWGKIFGGSVAAILIDTEDPSEYYKPMQAKEVNNVRLHIADRWTGVRQSAELVSDPGDEDYGTPKYYWIHLNGGQVVQFHHTRVLRMVNKKAPKIISDTLQGWGIPEGLHLFNELNRDEKMKNMITSLLNKYNLEVIKMNGMRAYMNANLSPEAEAQLDARLEMINRYRSFNSLVFLDKDDEYIREDGSSMSGLADLLEKNKSLVAGAASMPMVLLYGDQQKGLSGNSFDDMQLYDQKIMAEKNGDYRRALRKLLVVLAKSVGIEEPEKLRFSYNSIIPISESDKIENTKSILDVYKTLIDMGIYTNDMMMRELKGRDDLVFGSELTDDVIEEIIEEEANEEAEDENPGIGEDFESNLSEDENQDLDEELSDLGVGGDIDEV